MFKGIDLFSGWRSSDLPEAAQQRPSSHSFNCQGRGGAFYFNFLKSLIKLALEQKHTLYVFVKKRAAFVCFFQKESGPRVVKSGHGPDHSLAACLRPSSTSDEGGSVVPNSRLITAVI